MSYVMLQIMIALTMNWSSDMDLNYCQSLVNINEDVTLTAPLVIKPNTKCNTQKISQYKEKFLKL